MVLGGLRIGKLSTKFLELRGPSASPVLAPVDYAHIGMGFAVDTGGSIVRVGIGDAGPYIAGHIVNGTWEIDPSLALSGAGTVVRFGMRRRFSLGRP